MIGEIADVVFVREGHREGCCVVRLALDAASRFSTAHEVVFVVADFRADAQPIWPPGDRFRHGEHYRLHSCDHTVEGMRTNHPITSPFYVFQSNLPFLICHISADFS